MDKGMRIIWERWNGIKICDEFVMNPGKAVSKVLDISAQNSVLQSTQVQQCKKPREGTRCMAGCGRSNGLSAGPSDTSEGRAVMASSWECLGFGTGWSSVPVCSPQHCEFRMRGHYHCLRPGCYFVTNITTKLPWHVKKHEKAERRAANGFKYFTKREECGRLGEFCSVSHVVCPTSRPRIS